MCNTDNSHLAELINEIIAAPGDTIPEDLRSVLMDGLASATFICPTDDEGNIGLLGIGPNTFIPACLDMEDFRRIFKDEGFSEYEFMDFSKVMKGFIDGVMVNPGSFGFIVNPGFANMVFSRIRTRDMPPVEKGYDVKVRMNEMRPIHWRDVIIPDNITFHELDDILKTLWGFNGYHLSMFMIRNERIHIMDSTVAESCMENDYFDSKTTLIRDFFDKYKKITYWYDFGDDWMFDIEIKKTVDYDKDYVTIKRFKGKYNPIEDCGGIYGLSETIYFAEHPEEEDDDYYSENVEYLCEFDMDYAQELLKSKNYVRRMYE